MTLTDIMNAEPRIQVDGLPVVVKTERGIRCLGHARDHDGAQTLATVARIAHVATSRAVWTPTGQELFIVRGSL